ncbi:DUF362 domain-containing protein [Oceanispirochaeta sp.]|jgi:uncharacterized protein (DUF362 family)|uniref:DUF362 domain-containing protein n=1 Tax=Oceanispirochaeta sp. TaxID=2035350 RepID=UPI00262F0786|nr:DUF362 domain-containing protein [Oceanispirochaeta sp.]MDA3956979.1 DUF362 domain-containing protein [Oceanispirochaeta sp.]
MTEDKILCWYGSDPFEAGQKLMEASDVWKNWSKTESIGLKPNLVVSKKASSGATTHPEFCAGVIAFLQGQGFENLSILEGSWVGDRTERAFRICGYTELAQKYSLPLVDLQKDESVTLEATNGDYRVCQAVLNLDRLINIPVLKGHCQTAMTCALKNLKGCIPDSEKQRYHREGLFQPIADLNEILHADLILVDALEGDPDFEEGGNPQTLNLFMAALDPVLLDSYACSLLGLNIEDVPYITKAAELGAGTIHLKEDTLVPLNKGEGLSSLQRSSLSSTLAAHIHEKGACSACYASLVQALKILQEQGKALPETVMIGQGFKGLTVEGLGFGQCLSGCSSFVPGCPPELSEIVDFLSFTGNKSG